MAVIKPVSQLSPHQEERDGRHWEAVEEATELLMEGSYEEGLRELKKVIEGDPNNPYAYHYLGAAFFELGQLAPAADAYRAALALSPNYLASRVALSHVLRRLRDARGARAQALEALSRFPGDGDALHALGLAQATMGERKEARRSLQGYLEKNPEFEVAQEVRGILEMLGIGDDDEPLDLDE